MGRLGIGIVDACKVDHDTDGVVAAFALRQLVVLAADNGLSVRPDAGAVDVAVFHEDMNTADAEDVARGIQLTSAYTQIGDINTRDAVVARVEGTAVDQRIVAVVQVDAVRAADAGDVGHRRVAALVQLMHEVARISRRIAVQRNIVAVREIDHVRTAVAFLAVGVIAMHAVDDGAFFTDDGEVVFPVCRDDGTAVFVPRLSVIPQEQKHVGVILNAFRKWEDTVVLAVVGALNNGAGLQIHRRVGMHVKPCCTVGAGRENNLSAAVFAEVEYRLQRIGLQEFSVCGDAVFGYVVDFHNSVNKHLLFFPETVWFYRVLLLYYLIMHKSRCLDFLQIYKAE